MVRKNGGDLGFLDARLCVSAFLAMGVMTFSTVLYGETLYGGEDDAGARLVRGFGRMLLILFSVPVFLMLGAPLLRGAWVDLRSGLLRMDGLITVATLAAFGLSLRNTFLDSGEVYFETATMVLVLVTFGRRLEAHVRREGQGAALVLAELLPEQAHRREGERFEVVDPATLAVGDVVRVPPGESVPADLVVLEGSSTVQSAHLTGESIDRFVEIGDDVPCAAVNGTGLLVGRVSATHETGTLGKLCELLESPLSDSERLRLSDRLASRLGLATVTVALVTLLRSTFLHGLGEGIDRALAVLLVACPCALGLATPLAYRAMRTALAKAGVLVHDAVALEVGASIDTVILDKTGTLTEVGRELRPVDGSRADTEACLAALVGPSGHALAAAFDGGTAAARHLRTVPGRGVVGKLNGRSMSAGSPRWMDERGKTWSPALASHLEVAGSSSMVALADGDEVVGVARIDQVLAPGAEKAIAGLEALGLECRVVSGDRTAAADEIGEALGIDAVGGATPGDKLSAVESLIVEGKTVMAAGDGVNDAPLIRAAHLGVAVGAASRTTRSVAGVELLGRDVSRLVRVVTGCRALRRVVRGNLAWTIAYNTVAVALAATGLLHPLAAVASMIVSSLIVATRSARLLDFGSEDS